MSERLYLFTRFERFWHWSQAALIITLLISGFAIHGSHSLLDFRTAVTLHESAAWLLIGLWIFAIFWHCTTGQWRQYIPTLNNLQRVALYYAHGIFTGAPHPYKVSLERKHNPLQRIAYLGVLLVINPLIWLSGLLYLFWGRLIPHMPGWLSLEWLALTHTFAAFLMLIFLIVHIYLTTTGHTPLAHIKAMLSGWTNPH
ncbi:cytochrome B561 [Pseudomonas sp. 1-7]|nr:cytochrome B561 [Pseudomonas sp. 1-7]